MRDWVSMVFAALDAEFPEWEIAQDFRVFDISGKTSLTQQAFDESLKRLAHRVGVDVHALRVQLVAVLPLARRRYDFFGNSKAAMRAAIQEFAERMKVADHTLDGLRALRRVVCVWLTMTCSTTGVEHLFAGAANTLPKSRGFVGRARRHDELICVRYIQVHGWKPLLSVWPGSLGSLAEPGGGLPRQAVGRAAVLTSTSSAWGSAAQGVWRRCYPSSRRRLRVRRDLGTRRGQQKHVRTEKGFLAARRLAVDDASARSGVDAEGFAPGSDSAKTEVLLQQARRVRKLCEEAGQNAFPIHDGTSTEVRRAVRLATGRMATRVDSSLAKKAAFVPLGDIVKRLRAARARAAPVLAGGAAPPDQRGGSGSSAGKQRRPAKDIPIAPLTNGRLGPAALARCKAVARRVFVHPGCHLSEAERQQLLGKGLVVSTSLLEGDVFLAEGFAGVDHDMLLAMFLVGGRLVTRSFLDPSKRAPVMLQFLPAPFVRRLWLSFSVGLRAARPRQVGLVEDAAKRPGSQWTVVPESNWAMWHNSPKRNSCFAVCTSAEISSMTGATHGVISWPRL